MSNTKSTKKSISIRMEESALKKITRAAKKSKMSKNKFFSITMEDAADIVLGDAIPTLGSAAAKIFMRQHFSDTKKQIPEG